MLRILYLMIFAYTFAACGGEATVNNDENNHEHHDHDGHDHDGHDHDHHDHEDHQLDGDSVHFGTIITPEGGIALADVCLKIDNEEGAIDYEIDSAVFVKAIEGKVEGKVTEVCQKAGCWLTLASEAGEELFVMTNHDFFVPLDIVGKTVVVDGNAFKSITSVAELQHYAEDEGKSAEEIAEITEPITEYKLVANGIVIKL
ncbi:MAG: DUF4920 domain-containing protein [Saprospiraceae bacterium]|nr:DUF4920 domain-containing protein [Saprospiraceae bacterium]